MNNQNEFQDETKPLNPEALTNINSSQGDGNTDKPVDKLTIDTTDVTSYKALPRVSKHFVRLQDLSDHVYNKVRVPFANDDFRHFNVPLSRNRVPCVPKKYFPDQQGFTGTVINYWAEGGLNDSRLKGLIVDQDNFTVKMDANTSARMMTAVTIWSNEYLDKGVRDARARPNVILGDWGWTLPPNFSTTTRNIRTDVIARWMYTPYTASATPETLTLINASDLKQFMNITGGYYWPVPIETLCLALHSVDSTTVQNLALFGQDTIIDFDSSITTTHGARVVTPDGLVTYQVSLTANVPIMEPSMTQVLNATYSAIDIQWALFNNTIPIANASYAYPSNMKLNVYINTISDQFINFFMTKKQSLAALPTDSTKLSNFIKSWRLFKTLTVDRTLAEIGVFGTVSSNNTYGKTLTDTNYYDLICGSFTDMAPSSLTSNLKTILWIPYEMWIANGANIKLDNEEYVDGESPYPVNKKYCCPRSQVLVSQSAWTNETATITTKDYYIPNKSSSAVAFNHGATSTLCMPCTLPNYASTSETMTLPWDKSQTIDFVYTSCGKNSNSIFQKKLVFSTAAEN